MAYRGSRFPGGPSRANPNLPYGASPLRADQFSSFSDYAMAASAQQLATRRRGLSQASRDRPLALPVSRRRGNSQAVMPSQAWDPYADGALVPYRPLGRQPRQPAIDASPHLPDRVSNTERPSETPIAHAYSLGLGAEITVLLDTGASLTSVSLASLRNHFRNPKIDYSRTITLRGVGGGTTSCIGRVNLQLKWHGVDGRTIITKGEAWVCPPGHMEALQTDVLLGLPYMRDNGMNLRWSGVQRRPGGVNMERLGDRLLVRGVPVEIFIA